MNREKKGKPVPWGESQEPGFGSKQKSILGRHQANLPGMQGASTKPEEKSRGLGGHDGVEGLCLSVRDRLVFVALRVTRGLAQIQLEWLEYGEGGACPGRRQAGGAEGWAPCHMRHRWAKNQRGGDPETRRHSILRGSEASPGQPGGTQR